MNWRRMKTKKIHLNHETPILLLIVFSFLLISFALVKRFETRQYEKQTLEIIHKRNVENRKTLMKLSPKVKDMKRRVEWMKNVDPRARKILFWMGVK